MLKRKYCHQLQVRKQKIRIGKKLSLEITVGTVTEENLPECNDAFVKENTEYESLDEYREGIKKDLPRRTGRTVMRNAKLANL